MVRSGRRREKLKDKDKRCCGIDVKFGLPYTMLSDKLQ